jgi:amino acid permease
MASKEPPMYNSKEVNSTNDKDSATSPVDIQKGTVEIRQDRIIIEDGLRRGLEGRHITLISLASVIGASCFYGFGYAIYLSGPLGALIGFGIVGTSSSNRGQSESNSSQDSQFGL